MEACSDEKFMTRALELAQRGWGRTNPNPLVGAVVVREGEIVGEGYHAARGLPHAEVKALEEAGTRARGSTLYVNLEPCSHQGRTPPCADAIIAAGVTRVVVAMGDPNPEVNGQGLAALKAAGVSCSQGVMESEARRLNEIFAHYITNGLPWVIMKTAMSLDGKVATAGGDSRWVTGPEAREHVHQWRDRVAAIVVGIGTVLADNPRLTARPSGREGNDPVRVVLDSGGRLPAGCQLLQQDSAAPTLVAVTDRAPARRREALERAGAEVVVLERSGEGVDVSQLLRELGERHLDSVLLEGGGIVNASFLEAGLVQKVMFYLAPRLVGGRDAPTPVEGTGVLRMEDAQAVELERVSPLGRDLLLEGYLSGEGQGHVYRPGRGTGEYKAGGPGEPGSDLRD